MELGQKNQPRIALREHLQEPLVFDLTHKYHGFPKNGWMNADILLKFCWVRIDTRHL